MAISNTELTKRVVKKLVDDERTKDYAIEVVDNSGVITLTGAVSSIESRQAAEEIIESVEGVKSVINDLTVEEEVEDYRGLPAAGLLDFQIQ
jgi:osmotically-inducible protein OsmY